MTSAKACDPMYLWLDLRELENLTYFSIQLMLVKMEKDLDLELGFTVCSKSVQQSLLNHVWRHQRISFTGLNRAAFAIQLSVMISWQS